MPAVSVRRRLLPRSQPANSLPSANSISAGVKSPSGPMMMVIDSGGFDGRHSLSGFREKLLSQWAMIFSSWVSLTRSLKLVSGASKGIHARLLCFVAASMSLCILSACNFGRSVRWVSIGMMVSAPISVAFSTNHSSLEVFFKGAMPMAMAGLAGGTFLSESRESTRFFLPWVAILHSKSCPLPLPTSSWSLTASLRARVAW